MVNIQGLDKEETEWVLKALKFVAGKCDHPGNPPSKKAEDRFIKDMKGIGF